MWQSLLIPTPVDMVTQFLLFTKRDFLLFEIRFQLYLIVSYLLPKDNLRESVLLYIRVLMLSFINDVV